MALKDVYGITRVADVTGLDRIGIPVAVACRPNSRSLAISQGKGLSLDAAMASALMESVETYHAERSLHPLNYASYEEIRFADDTINIARLPRVAAGQYHPCRPLLWVEANDLMANSERRAWLPYEMVHTNYTVPMPAGNGCFISSSNGLASGNTLEEATSHAICEVVERDAVAVWSQLSGDARHRHRINLGSIDDETCAALLLQFDAAGLDVAVWDVTSDLGIPAMLAWIAERDGQEKLLRRTSVGAGCHPSSAIALSRALTEAAQERLALITGARDDLRQEFYAEHSHRDVFEREGRRRFADVPNKLHETCADDVAWALRCLKSKGIDEVLRVDLSPTAWDGYAVVRVVIPGLESAKDDHRYVPGPRARQRTLEPS